MAVSKTVLSRFSPAQACLCSCFPRGTFSSLHSWCRSDSRAARKSRRVVDEVGLPVKQKVIFAHFSVFPLQVARCWIPTPTCTRFWCGTSGQWRGASKSPGSLCNQRCLADVEGLRIPIQKENKARSGGCAARGVVEISDAKLVIL